MYGDSGNKLVQHAKLMAKLDHVPSYQSDLVRSVVHEVHALDQSVNRILSNVSGSFDPSANPAQAATLLVNHLSLRRNKRCLLAYHRTRAEKLKALVWQESDGIDMVPVAVSPGATGGEASEPSASRHSLSPEEEEYMRQFSDLLAALKGQWTDIDLTGSLEPPRDLFIDVRVLKDAGEIQTEYGLLMRASHSTINLSKNSQFYVRHGDVERLIAQGYLQNLS
ncbi:BgTH12-05569 [Blumeria graminis f. sp. triticale]|uniref:DNA replication complex GINS protein PSF1 n=1 Tax=Blumeria graminis f. sp. triticale TaxID=1689686 RepID=A0A9W4D495_BLUGR|nr:BgTH12-05569 [Blumeria graminis f. sp. triticale]